MSFKYLYLFLSLALLLSLATSSCDPNELLEDPSAKLEFSVDTLQFDTVFTTLGSATRFFKIYNPHDQPILVSSITLENGNNSNFRINIDGTPTPIATDIEIAANDSLYIFAEVTVDPNDINSPFVMSEYIHFETNGNEQKVLLEAWGQNANYIGSKGGAALLSCDLGTFLFDDPKPYVIYGILVVDSCELVLPPGTRLHVYGGLARNGDGFYNDGIIFFFPNGRLTSQGTLDNPVIIEGARLETEFANVPGQWAGILLSPGSTGHSIAYTEIKNANVGIRVDSAVDLSIKHSSIHTTNSANILAVHASIDAENSLFYSSNGGNNLQLEFGGDYNFDFCTIVTYGSVDFIRHERACVRMTNYRCYTADCVSSGEYGAWPLDAQFNNCIIYGTNKDEVSLTDVEDGTPFDFNFKNCALKIDEITNEDNFPTFLDHTEDCLINQDPLFVDAQEVDYHLDTLSPVEEMAFPIPSITLDFEENLRDGAMPDMGAYEYQY